MGEDLAERQAYMLAGKCGWVIPPQGIEKLLLVANNGWRCFYFQGAPEKWIIKEVIGKNSRPSYLTTGVLNLWSADP